MNNEQRTQLNLVVGLQNMSSYQKELRNKYELKKLQHIDLSYNVKYLEDLYNFILKNEWSSLTKPEMYDRVVDKIKEKLDEERWELELLEQELEDIFDAYIEQVNLVTKKRQELIDYTKNNESSLIRTRKDK